MKKLIVATTLCASLVAAGCAPARAPASGSGVVIKIARTSQVPAGQESQVGSWATADTECKPDFRDVRVTQQPSHGTTRLDKAPATPGEKELAACRSGEKPGHRLFYKPKAGFTGVDVLSVEVVHAPTGGRMDMTITVQVR